MKKTICVILVLVFAAVIVYSCYRIWGIQADYKKEAELHGAVMEYRPEDPSEFVNQSVIDLQAKYPDAAGWLTVPGTNVDYPFVQGKDNGYYLRRDIDGNDAAAGTIFMDSRCARDFTSRNTILYGHHMKNSSMFGTLKAFNDKSFYENNRQGVIYLPRSTLTLEIFAYMVIDPSTEKEIYNPALSDTYFDCVQQNAKHYRDIGITTEDRIVTLSTCAYEFDNARMVLLARVLPERP